MMSMSGLILIAACPAQQEEMSASSVLKPIQFKVEWSSEDPEYYVEVRFATMEDWLNAQEAMKLYQTIHNVNQRAINQGDIR